MLELWAFVVLIAAQFSCALFTIAHRASIYPDQPRGGRGPERSRGFT